MRADGCRRDCALHLTTTHTAPREGPHWPRRPEAGGGSQELLEPMSQAHVPGVEGHTITAAPAPPRPQPAHDTGLDRPGIGCAPERDPLHPSRRARMRAHSRRHPRPESDSQRRARQLPPCEERQPSVGCAIRPHRAVRCQHIRVEIHHPVRISPHPQPQRMRQRPPDIGWRGQAQPQVERPRVAHSSEQPRVERQIVGRACHPAPSEAGRGEPPHRNAVDRLRRRVLAAAVVRTARAHDHHVMAAHYQPHRQVVEVLASRSHVGRVELVGEQESHSAPILL